MDADNSQGRRYIWAIWFFLFVSTFVGGIFLVLYMIRPESSSTAWYPIVGIILVCLPWIFWLITCFYRFLSRKFGFRMVCWGNDDNSVDSMNEEDGRISKTTDDVSDDLEKQNMSTMNKNTTNQSHTKSWTNSLKQVHFGQAVVMTEKGSNNPSRSMHSRESSYTDIPLTP